MYEIEKHFKVYIKIHFQKRGKVHKKPYDDDDDGGGERGCIQELICEERTFL